jgi:hypothetical protein
VVGPNVAVHPANRSGEPPGPVGETNHVLGFWCGTFGGRLTGERVLSVAGGGMPSRQGN